MRKNTKIVVFENFLDKTPSKIVYCGPGFCIDDLNLDKDNYIFYINGKPANHKYKLKPEDTLTVYFVPKDMENNYVRGAVKIGVQLAVAYLTQDWSRALQAVALLSTNIAANYLLPTNVPQDKQPDNLLSGAITSPKEGLRIPKIFGKVFFTPPMAARPHLNPGSSKNASLVYCVCLGYGPLDLEGQTTSLQINGTTTTPFTINDIPDGSIFIGGTDVKLAQGIELEIGDPNYFTLYKNLVYDQVVNFSFDRTTGREGGWLTDNVEHIQTMGAAGKDITINLHFTNGLFTRLSSKISFISS